MKKLILFITVFLIFAGFAHAQIISQSADAINFPEGGKSVVVTITYNCQGSREFNVTVPAGSGFEILTTGLPCANLSSTLANCAFTTQGQTGTYTITHPSPTTMDEYSTYEFPSFLSNTTGCSVQNNVTFIRMPDQEIFHTLVEFGRGRGNYFYDTLQSGVAGSGHTGVGCSYVPNNTLFELNFLHKVLNIKQYFDNPDFLATNATFTCTYPNRTIVREHLGTSIAKGSNQINISYFIDEIEGSWERMAFLGMDFETNEQFVGENLTISCSGVNYFFEGAGGFVTVFTNSTEFTLQVRNPQPFVASASTTSIIGNGTQEVIITYNITNTELYTGDDVIIEINAPQYSTFIGTRAELWGTGLDQYRIEKTQLAPGESEIIQLVARFDTSNAQNITGVNLTNGIKIKYAPCWESNAYNPTESIQTLTNIGSATVDMSISSQLFNIQDTLTTILNSLAITNTTLININSTVSSIEAVTEIINQTTTETNLLVKEINNTVNAIASNITDAINNTNLIITDTTAIKDLIDCDGSGGDTPICQDLLDMNSTATNIVELLISINTTLGNLTIDVTVDLSNQNLSVNVTPDLTNISLIINGILDTLNCTNLSLQPPTSVCNKVINIQNTTFRINQSVNSVNDIINYFNNTIFGGISLTDIYNSINNITIDTTSLLSEIQKIREFGEELIFLITDSFGLQQSARTDLANGDLNSAASKLRDANTRLKEAAGRLNELQAQAAQEQEELTATATTKDAGWLTSLFAFFVITIIVIIYLFSKPQQRRRY